MKIISSAIVSASLLLCAAMALASEPTTYRLYFLGGQSNMEGFGFNDELPDEYRARSTDVMIFRGQMALDNTPHGGIGVWRPLEPGFGTGFQTNEETVHLSDRFGPELLFGLTMAQRQPGAKIAIVKYALGGSGLADGVGYGNWHPDFRQVRASTSMTSHSRACALRWRMPTSMETVIPIAWFRPGSSGCRAKQTPSTARRRLTGTEPILNASWTCYVRLCESTTCPSSLAGSRIRGWPMTAR